jgi:peroxiredoxin Q/BCP
LARLRDDYREFVKRDAEIIAVGPDRPAAFRLYWRAEGLPFVGLPDPEHRVALLYRQQVDLFRLGRMPLVTVVDRNGVIQYAHYGASMSDIPENRSLLSIIDGLRES